MRHRKAAGMDALAHYCRRVCSAGKRDFILSLGFALQRANFMLRNADRTRRKARSCGLYSSGTRPSSLSSDDDY